MKNLVIKIADINIALQSDRELFVENKIAIFLEKHPEHIDEQIYIQDIDIQKFEKLRNTIEKHYTKEYTDDSVEFYSGPDGLANVYSMIRNKNKCYMLLIQDGEGLHLYPDQGYWDMFTTEGKFFKHLALEYILLKHDAFYLHSSLIIYNNQAIIFSGNSGIGKSTQANLWNKYKNARILNGDRSIIRYTDRGFRAYGSPFAGSSDIFVNEGGDIGALVFLGQSQTNTVKKLDKKMAVSNIFLQSMVRSGKKSDILKSMNLLDKLTESVPVYFQNCTKDQLAVETLYNTLYPVVPTRIDASKDMKKQPEIKKMLLIKSAAKKIPVSGTFELTPFCNMNCKMCYIKSDYKSADLKSVEWWLERAKQAKASGTIFLLLTGGEIFTYPDFKRLYLALGKMGFVISLNTNATLIDDQVISWLKNSPPSRINITLYGASNDTYKKLCGNSLGYTQVTNAIDKLIENNFNLHINVSLTKENVDEIPQMLEYLQTKKLAYTLAPYMFPSGKRNDKTTYKRIAPELAGYMLYKYVLEKEDAKVQDLDIKIGTEAGSESFGTKIETESSSEKTETESSSEKTGTESLGTKTETKFSKAEDKLSNTEKEFKLSEKETEECMRGSDQHMGCMAGKSSYWVTYDGFMLPCGMLPWIATSLEYNDIGQAFTITGTQVDKVFMPAKCVTCKKRPECPVCAAAVMTENDGDMTRAPEYICRMMGND